MEKLIEKIDLFTEAFVEENNRRKKQATLEFVTRIRDNSWNLEMIIKNEIKDMHNLDEVDKITINKFLSITEKLATGVNMDIYDYSVVSRTIGHYLISMYNLLQPYIIYRRNDGISSSKTAHEYEMLKNKIFEDRT